MIKAVTIFTFLMLGFSSCQDKLDYSTSKMGIVYHFKGLGEADQITAQGDYVLLNIEYLTQNDSVFYSSKQFKLDHFDHIRLENKETCKFQNLLSELNVGDSISASINALDFFTTYLESSVPDFIDEKELLKINFRIKEELSVVAHEQLLEEQKDLYEMKELSLIDEFLANDTSFVMKQGIYIKKFSDSIQPDSLKLDYGQSFYLNYEGRFLKNDNLFYSTYRNTYPDEFNYGIKGQLIEGLMIAISGSHKGDSLVVIIPSQLGFGDKYSAGNIVPPYTPLIYNLKIEKSYTLDTTLLN